MNRGERNDLRADAPVKTNWSAIVAALVAMATAATAWADIKYAVAENQKNLLAAIKGVVHVDDIERLEIQIQLQNPDLKLQMPPREQFMRHPDTTIGEPSNHVAMIERAALFDAVSYGEPHQIGAPAGKQGVIENSHQAASSIETEAVWGETRIWP